jgi:hypothetical protein
LKKKLYSNSSLHLERKEIAKTAKNKRIKFVNERKQEETLYTDFHNKQTENEKMEKCVIN